jgi:hypothetical protein
VKAVSRKKEGKGECSNKFGIDKFEKCIFVVV